MTVFREFISAIPEAWRTKWSDLPVFQTPLHIVDRNAELEFEVDMEHLDELETELTMATDGVLDDLQHWFWSQELDAAGCRLVQLWALIDDEFTIGDQPSFPTFQDIWDAAGQGRLIETLEAL